MDGIVVYLAGVTPAAVEQELRALQLVGGDDTFVYFMYSDDKWMHELDEGEREAISHRLGQQPSAAAAICCRPGPTSRMALDALLRLLTTFPDSLVDDDFGKLWSPEELKALDATAAAAGLLALRNWLRPSG